VPDPEEQAFGPSETIDERKVRLSQVLARTGSKLIYTYDFGDNWQHSVVLEKCLPADSKMNYPACLAGARACPPEDCGGVYGFSELLDAIQDPQHERHGEMLEWVGEEYDPDEFSVEKINRAL
jgi:Plasmid pRiA4b ORF-3-like protein